MIGKGTLVDILMRLAAIVCGLFLAAVARGEEGPAPPSGRTQLASGREVAWTFHYDRNALRDSVRVGDALIALTNAGTLLCFDLPTVRLGREGAGTDAVTCLGRGEGGVALAGLGDGRVCRVDPVTLGLTEIAKLPHEPRWIGWGEAHGARPAGLVVVTRTTRPLDQDGRHWDVPSSTVHDLATGKVFALEDEGSTFLLDHSGRFWLGADRGEWGGRITRVDLVAGTVAEIPPPPSHDPDRKAYWQGIYGFVEPGDGQVWAFGGTSHMGFHSSFITRIDAANPIPLVAFDRPPRDPEKAPDPDHPRLPITHLIATKDHFLIFSYSDVFRVDQALKSWKKVATLAIRYRWGRPDAVGSYPAVRAIHPPVRDGDPYVLATVADGYLSLHGDKSTPRGLPGQIGAEDIARIENTAEGTFFFPHDDRQAAWTLKPSGWEVALLAPPFEADPDNGFEKNARGWYETRVLVGPDGSISTVSGTGVTPGTRTTARRVAGKSVRIGREKSLLNPSSSFMTADGTLWNASRGELQRFDVGAWATVTQDRLNEWPSRLDAVATTGPPWWLVDRYADGLWTLDPGKPGAGPTLQRVEVRDGANPLRVAAAIPRADGSLLLATDAGLQTYDSAGGMVARLDLEGPAPSADVLTRDRLGRLWLGGDAGLWLVDPARKAAEPLAAVPWLGRDKVVALAPDPARDDGVIASFASGGVAFLQAMPMP